MLLVSHIGGAIITGVVVITSVIAMTKSRESWYRPIMKILAACGAFQVISGFLLFIFQIQQRSFIGICTKVGIYLVVIGAAEFALYFRSTIKRLQPDPHNG